MLEICGFHRAVTHCCSDSDSHMSPQIHKESPAASFHLQAKSLTRSRQPYDNDVIPHCQLCSIGGTAKQALPLSGNERTCLCVYFSPPVCACGCIVSTFLMQECIFNSTKICLTKSLLVFILSFLLLSSMLALLQTSWAAEIMTTVQGDDVI